MIYLLPREIPCRLLSQSHPGQMSAGNRYCDVVVSGSERREERQHLHVIHELLLLYVGHDEGKSGDTR